MRVRSIVLLILVVLAIFAPDVALTIIRVVIGALGQAAASTSGVVG